jgi:hypothetical protein
MSTFPFCGLLRSHASSGLPTNAESHWCKISTRAPASTYWNFPAGGSSVARLPGPLPAESWRKRPAGGPED